MNIYKEGWSLFKEAYKERKRVDNKSLPIEQYLPAPQKEQLLFVRKVIERKAV